MFSCLWSESVHFLCVFWPQYFLKNTGQHFVVTPQHFITVRIRKTRTARPCQCNTLGSTRCFFVSILMFLALITELSFYLLVVVVVVFKYKVSIPWWDRSQCLVGRCLRIQTFYHKSSSMLPCAGKLLQMAASKFWVCFGTQQLQLEPH